MTSGKPRRVVIFGLIGMFLAVALPISLIGQSISAAIVGAVAGITLTSAVGYPFFCAIASWIVPQPDSSQLDQHYRSIDSHVSGSGRAAIGYAVGCTGAILAQAARSPVPNELKTALFVTCCATAIASIFIVMFAAASKIVLHARVEPLQRRAPTSNSGESGPV